MKTLTPLEVLILGELTDNAGSIVHADVLAECKVAFVKRNEANRIAAHIKNIRRKLPRGQKIETVRGHGYKLITK